MGNRTARQNRDALRAAMEASAKEAPVPIGWDEIVSEKGMVYYVDHLNQKTTFSDPRLSGQKLKKQKKAKKGKPPAYEYNLYSRTQHLIAKLRQRQQDEGQLEVIISREKLFDESFAFFMSIGTYTLTRRLFVKFEGEDGLDYGGMSRELLLCLSQEFVHPDRHLFCRSSDGYLYLIDRFSILNEKYIEYFKFFGIILGIAVYHNRLLTLRFPLSFYKQLLGKKLELADLKDIDKDVYRSMKQIKNASDVTDWDLYFTVMDKDINGNTETIELKNGGEDIPVTNENKEEFINLVLNHYLNTTKPQMDVIKSTFYEFVPLDFIQDFEPNELEQIISGAQQIDVNDLKAHTEYGDGYTDKSESIKLFWEVLMSFQEEELVKFLQFTTGTNKVPVGGFGHLYGSNGPQKFQIIPKKLNGLPTAHSCFNRLELPNYTDKEKLKRDLLYAVTETAGFGLE
jgi:hypothetical protein